MAFNQYGGPTAGNAGLDSPQYTQGWNTETSTGDEETGQAPASFGGGSGANTSGYAAWTSDPFIGTYAGAALATSGAVYVAKVFLPVATKVTNVNLWNTAVGNATVMLAGIYSSAGALLASSADFHGALANGLQTVALSSPTLIPNGWAYVAVGNVGTTTAFEALTWAAPTNFAENGYTAAASMTLATLNSSPNTAQRFFVGATGVTTALPANLVAAQFSATTIGLWSALN